MRRALLVVLPALTWAQTADVIKRGEEVFTKTCGTGYCHGAKGTGGGAPRLAARGFELGYINTTVRGGVAGTPMQAFAPTLPAADITAVIAYVASLNGIEPAGAPPPAKGATQTLNGEAARGRILFSEATRGFARCSTCHEVNGIGLPVTAPIAKVPADAPALKALATPGVSTAAAGGESMPILMVSKRSQSVAFYDLTSLPPVLRTVAPADVRLTDGSIWRHSSVLGTYSDAELNAILAYLRAAQR
jgi:mono/diheme cytochrome c family protein